MSDSSWPDFSAESRLRQAFNLYHANFWVIGPATAGHGRGGCSYVELVATSAQMQRPLWQLGSRNIVGKHGVLGKGWEKMGQRELSQARFAIGDVANHDGVARLVAIPGHGFKSKWHKNEQTRKTNKPIGSMYGIFTYIWVIYGVNVGKYSIHGASGKCFEWFV